MLKKLKYFIAIIVAVLGVANTAYAEFYSVPEELSAYGNEVYSEARSRFGRSFSGYCGTYVSQQLRVMGICDEKNYFRGNGNRWYANFDGVRVTSGGYHVYRESGGDCLAKLAENYGNDLDNIVLSFPIQSGYSAKYPGAGHALVIYKLKDGIAYYSESFSFGNYPEGTVIAEDAKALVERYSRRHGAPIGCVLLSESDLSDGEKVFFKTVKDSLGDLSYLTLSAARTSGEPVLIVT